MCHPSLVQVSPSVVSGDIAGSGQIVAFDSVQLAGVSYRRTPPTKEVCTDQSEPKSERRDRRRLEELGEVVEILGKSLVCHRGCPTSRVRRQQQLVLPAVTGSLFHRTLCQQPLYA